MATPTGARVSTVKNGNLDDMNIAIGSDHRGAKFARLLTYNVLMPNHYTAQSEYLDANAEPVAGAFMIENAAVGDAFAEDGAKDAKIYPIEYSAAVQTPPEQLHEGQVDYPDVAAAVAEAVAEGRADRGILICGTGIGMCITANKFRGIRAALCYNEVAAELSRRHNNANILCLSGNFLSEANAEAIARLWLVAPFDGDRHQRRLELIEKIERETGL